MQRRGSLSLVPAPDAGPAPARTLAPARAVLAGRRVLLVAVAALCVVVPAAIYAVSSDVGDDMSRPVFNSPLANSNFVLAAELASGRGFGLSLPHYRELPPDIAVALPPRDAAVSAGRVVPKTFLPELIAVAGLLALGESVGFWAKPVLGGFAVLAVFLLAYQLAGAGRIGRQRVAGPLAGVTAAVVFALHPAQWIIHSNPFTLTDTLALVTLLYGVAAAIPFFGGSSRSVGRALAVGVLLALSVAFRYPNLLLVALPLVAVGLSTRDVRVALALASPFMVVGLALASLHAVVYGSPTTTGHQLAVAGLHEAVTLSSSGFLSFNAAAFSRHVDYYLTSPELVGAAGVGILVAIGGFRAGSRAFRTYGAIAVAMSAGLLLLYGGQESHGIARFAVNASLMRYLLPAVALLIPLAAYGSLLLVTALADRASTIGHSAGIAASVVLLLLLSALLSSSVRLAIDGNGGVLHRRQTIERLALARAEVFSATDDNSLIITRLYDKILFPERSTLVATFLIGKDEVIEKGANVTWSFVPGTERLADVAARVNERGYRLFLLNDRIVARDEMGALSERLARDGLAIERVESVSAVPLYEVAHAPSHAGARTDDHQMPEGKRPNED